MGKRKSHKPKIHKIGLPPGSLVFTGEKKMETAGITVIDYDENKFQEKQVSKIEECFEYKSTSTVTWINIDGLHDVEIISKIGDNYDIHPLVLEDILHTGQRPKFEELDNKLFIVLMMLSFDQKTQKVKSEQVSLILGPNYVLSFQEAVGDVFEQVRDRLRGSKGRIRKMGTDYLLYALLDAIVDSYFTIMENMGDKIEDLEDELISNPTHQTLMVIHNLKREMINLRKSVWPLRELINSMQRCECGLIKSSTNMYLRDLYDHTIQVIDTVESFRDMVAGMLDIYLSTVSNRMNEVMKVLTIIATIFIPLTFIAGIYGMNFNHDSSAWNMPELYWKWGYPAVLIIMLAITAAMIYYFKKKKWL